MSPRKRSVLAFQCDEGRERSTNAGVVLEVDEFPDDLRDRGVLGIVVITAKKSTEVRVSKTDQATLVKRNRLTLSPPIVHPLSPTRDPRDPPDHHT